MAKEVKEALLLASFPVALMAGILIGVVANYLMSRNDEERGPHA